MLQLAERVGANDRGGGVDVARSLAENELNFLPLVAAGLERRVDSTPFRLEDPARLRVTLETAGFRAVTIQAYEQAVSSDDREAMLSVLLKVDPLGKIVRENPDLRSLAEPRVHAAFAA